MTEHRPARVRVIALGSPHGGDDALALELGARVVAPEYPGYGLLDAFACSPEVPPF